jgi:signal transduction histidine kinase
MSEILIVDDNPTNLELLGQILRERSHHVRSVTSGKRALDSSKISPPDLVLLDITMPEMDGFETCRRFKADPDLALVPIIFISALDATMDKVKAFALGGEDYISKPFQAEEVVARVNHQLRILSLQRDLVERNRVLGEAHARLQELDQLKASFTAMLVHDLRSPLTGIGGMLDLFEEEGTIHPTLLARSREYIHSTVTMLNDLMELYRSEGGAIPLEVGPVSMRDLLEGTLGSHVHLAKRKSIRLEMDCYTDLPEILVDRRQVERILANLVGNALKFTGENGTIRLEASLVEGAGVDLGLRWVMVTVTDTGQGIPAEQLPYIFDPYRQVYRRDAGLGFGLGLAIVQRLMAAHQGRVTVRSQLGVGTTFALYFPMS